MLLVRVCPPTEIVALLPATPVDVPLIVGLARLDRAVAPPLKVMVGAGDVGVGVGVGVGTTIGAGTVIVSSCVAVPVFPAGSFVVALIVTVPLPSVAGVTDHAPSACAVAMST